MLAGAGLGDDAGLAHAPRQQNLAQAIVDLVRAGVIEVFALQINLRAAEMLGQALGEIERAFAADIMGQQARPVRRGTTDPFWPPHRPSPDPAAAASGFRRQSGRHRRRNGPWHRDRSARNWADVFTRATGCFGRRDEIARYRLSLFTPGALSTPEDTSTICAPLTAMARATFSGVSPPARNQGRAKVAGHAESASRRPRHGRRDAPHLAAARHRTGSCRRHRHSRRRALARSAGSATGKRLDDGNAETRADIGRPRRRLPAMQLEKIRLHLRRRSRPVVSSLSSTTSAASLSRPRIRSARRGALLQAEMAGTFGEEHQAAEIRAGAQAPRRRRRPN